MQSRRVAQRILPWRNVRRPQRVYTLLRHESAARVRSSVLPTGCAFGRVASSASCIVGAHSTSRRKTMKMNWVTAAAVGALAAFCLVAAASAQAPSAPMPANANAAPGAGKLSHGDRLFVRNAAEAGMAEVQMAKAAQQRSTSADVKSFADRMVTDHGKANQQLASIVAAKGASVPDKLLHKDSQEMVKLELAAHKDAVKLFKREAEHGKDTELRNFAGSTLPVLQDHLSMVTALSKNMH